MTLIILLLFTTIVLPIVVILFILMNRDAIGKARMQSPAISSGKVVHKDTRLYDSLSSLPLIGSYLSSIKERLASSSIQNEYTVRNKAVFIAFTSVAVAILSFVFASKLYSTSLYLKAVMLIFSIYLGNFTAHTLSGHNIKLLDKLSEFINDIKHHYHASWMVDESIYEATLSSSEEMERHGRELYNVITSSKSEKDLTEYYDRSPNKFLKILAGFSFLVKEYGDRKVNGVSLYIKNLNYIIEEIYLETIRRSQIEYWLKGLPLIALIPILFPPMIEKWMGDSFPASGEFFQSTAAFFLKNLILFLVAVCYLLVLQLKGFGNQNTPSKQAPNKSEQYILYSRPVKILVSHLLPKPGSHRYKRTVNLLGDSGTFISLESLYLRRLLCGIGALLLFITIFSSAHRVNINAIMNDPAYGIKKSNLYQMLGKLTPDEQASRDNINKYDAEMIRLLSGKLNIHTRKNAVEEIKAELDKRGYELGDTQLAAERIYNKTTATAQEHLKLWELLLSILTAYTFSFIPVWLLYFHKILRKADMQDEVFQFHTVILLLMHHESVDVRKVLEWMHQLSDVFREPINRCLNNFQEPRAALARLKKDVKFKEFVYLIENLEIASDRISIKEAFDSLELDRDFYRENRKETNKRTVNSRIELGKLIGFLPFYGVIILYLVIPLLLVSITSLRTIIEQLSTR